ncbi:hypothetical protein BJ170DRAFT_719568 [Xylariales sp. AK1849]|nr:hypothetical protein BJ170DRAFT_719568 [Xylariales sp. AK1849]
MGTHGLTFIISCYLLHYLALRGQIEERRSSFDILGNVRIPYGSGAKISQERPLIHGRVKSLNDASTKLLKLEPMNEHSRTRGRRWSERKTLIGNRYVHLRHTHWAVEQSCRQVAHDPDELAVDDGSCVDRCVCADCEFGDVTSVVALPMEVPPEMLTEDGEDDPVAAGKEEIDAPADWDVLVLRSVVLEVFNGASPMIEAYCAAIFSGITDKSFASHWTVSWSCWISRFDRVV